jgi:hypothetical protein
MGMGHTNFRQSLNKRYSALTGQLEDVHASIARIHREVEKLPELEARIPQLERLIESARLLLEDADPDWQEEQAPPVKPWTHHIPVPFGQCGRRGMQVLRKSEVPMTVREVAKTVLREVGCEAPDAETLRRVQNAVEASFRKFRGRTVESSGKYPAQWRAINKPEITFDP